MNADNIELLAQKAAEGAAMLALADSSAKNLVLSKVAEGLERSSAEILAANAEDVAKAKTLGLSAHLIDRLTLDKKGLAELAAAVKKVIALNDPIGSLEDSRTLPDGLLVSRRRVPLGLIAFICEARPGALVEAGALALKSGNGLIAKCGREASGSAVVLERVFSEALSAAGQNKATVTVLTGVGPAELQKLLSLNEIIDLVIPRGGEGLIRFVSENSRIPVLKHYKGVCHTYIDQGADLEMAEKLIINSKTQRPSTCNSLEALLVHQSEAPRFLPVLDKKLTALGVAIKAAPAALTLMPHAQTADLEDWGREFLDLILAVKVVVSFDDALAHIAKYGSRHTETIVTSNHDRAERFLASVDAGCVMVNASTRLNDGGCLGLGAEIGISTTKLHAYGPMGLKELTTTKFVVHGTGQLRL